MKKFGLILSMFFLIIPFYKIFCTTQYQVVYGDVTDTLSTPLGPGIICTPSTNICCICATNYSFDVKPYQEHIGFFYPTAPGNPPTVGKGYTDVSVKRQVNPDGSQTYELTINPNNIMFYDYQSWKNYFDQQSK
ncbi:MAG: hypothetical protein ACPLW7_00885 [Minisyncoccia bacterium]|uniref:hypothetical protein n=1 Tax=Caldisericum exile TaxID=693075 RepID=UPI003C762779